MFHSLLEKIIQHFWFICESHIINSSGIKYKPFFIDMTRLIGLGSCVWHTRECGPPLACAKISICFHLGSCFPLQQVMVQWVQGKSKNMSATYLLFIIFFYKVIKHTRPKYFVSLMGMENCLNTSLQVTAQHCLTSILSSFNCW